MTQTPTRPRRPLPHAGDPSRDSYSADDERRAGTAESQKLLSSVYGSPDVYSLQNRGGSQSAADKLLEVAEGASRAGKRDQAALLAVVGMTPEYSEVQPAIDKEKAKADAARRRYGSVPEPIKREIKRLREQTLGFNEAMKEYLDTHSSQSLDYVSGFLVGAYRGIMRTEGHDARPTPDVTGEILRTARGMRGELAAEQILGKFEDVDIHYHLTDNTEVRRKLDAQGTDYMITVTVLGQAFDLAVDIKSSREATIERDRDANGELHEYTIPGKLWCQFTDADFIRHTSRVDSSTILRKALPMQDALINQICLQYPGRLEALCKTQGITLDDIDIN